MWAYVPSDGPPLILGEHDHVNGHDGCVVHIADSRELAQSWARSLRSGRIPSAESDPGDG